MKFFPSFFLILFIAFLAFPAFAQNERFESDFLYTGQQERSQRAYQGFEQRFEQRSPFFENERRFEDKKDDSEKERLTSLEILYQERSGKNLKQDLKQFGYDFFEEEKQEEQSRSQNISGKSRTVPAGMVQDDYVLGPGDKFDFTVRGQENFRRTVTVNSEGLLILKNFYPVNAAGKTFLQVQNDFQKQAEATPNTNIYMSLSGIRQIHVLVIGQVKDPGRKTLTSFHTALEALQESGGIKKTGSLRNIKLVRAGKTHRIDLYDFFVQNQNAKDMALKDGDRIIVPPLGATIAVAGKVKIPGIYEIKSGFSAQKALNLAGGFLKPGENRLLRLRLSESGQEETETLQNLSQSYVRDGDILLAEETKETRTDSIILSGHTKKPGLYDLKTVKTLSDLISSPDVLKSDTYPLIGLIKRQDPVHFTQKLIDFPLQNVLRKNYDLRLRNADEILLFSNEEIRELFKEEEEEKSVHSEMLQPIQFASEPHNLEAEEDITQDPFIAAYLKERVAFIRGAVLKPGAYPVSENTALSSVLSIAGGLSLEANHSNIEVTSRFQGKGFQSEGRSGKRRISVNLYDESPEDIMIGPGDTVRVNQKFHKIDDQSVTIMGEVAHPGRYDLTSGDSLSTLLERAGGLNRQAYPEGAIFSRASERRRELSRYKAQAQDLEMKLATSLQDIDPDERPDMKQITSVQRLITRLRQAEAVGRITVEADPGILASDPALDILLEPGDKIYIPRRPLTVRVAGEVLSPASLQFRDEKTPLDYIHEAGSFTYHADKDRTFVIYPDGAAQPLQVNAWNHKAIRIPPGSTIFVPRDPKPFDFLENAEKISQILANIAITGFYIDDLDDD